MNRKLSIAGGVAVVVVGLVFGLLSRYPDDQVNLAWLGDPASGSVWYCSGEDVSGTQARSVRDFKASPSRGTATATLDASYEPDASRQHNKYREDLRSGKCDLVYLDVAYMAEFAAEGLLYDMTPYLHDHGRQERFDEQMMQTVMYDGRLWGVPKQLDGGVLFYRKVRRTPRTWAEVFREAVPPGDDDLPGLRLPLEGYEGLTVVVLELAYSAGADPIVSEDGKVANLYQREIRDVVRALRDAMAARALPQAGSDQLEKGTLYAFKAGRARLMRNWVYAETRIKKDAERVARTTMVSRLPPWDGGGLSIGVLGGHNLVIPRSAKNPAGALHLIRFLTTPEQMRRDARLGSLAPPLIDWRKDQAVKDSNALHALSRTRFILRPTIPQYYKISTTISTAVGLLLDWGTGLPTTNGNIDNTLRDLQAKVTEMLNEP